MAKNMDLKMATVIEEDYEDCQCEIHENFDIHDFHGLKDKKNGHEENNNNKGIEDSKKTSGKTEDGEHFTLERTSSLVEKDFESTLDKAVLESIMKTPNTNKDSLVIPDILGPTALAFSPATSPNLARNRRFSKVKTLSMKDKYVTELCLFFPLRNQVFNMGIFLTTSRRFGEHSIYKISPISPFKGTRLKAQDRILKINNFDITRWSHFSVISLVKNIYSSNSTPSIQANAQDNSFHTILSLEYIRHSNTSISADQGPAIEKIEFGLGITLKGRIVMGNNISTSLQIQYKSASFHDLQIHKESVYIKAESTVSPTEAEYQPLVLKIGDKGDECQLKIHKFQTDGNKTESGNLVVFETFRSGQFLIVTSNDSGKMVSIGEGTDIKNLTTSDNRVFRMVTDKGTQDERYKIKSVHYDLYFKADFMQSSLTLVEPPEDGLFPNTMLFDKITANHC